MYELIKYFLKAPKEVIDIIYKLHFQPKLFGEHYYLQAYDKEHLNKSMAAALSLVLAFYYVYDGGYRYFIGDRAQVNEKIVVAVLFAYIIYQSLPFIVGLYFTNTSRDIKHITANSIIMIVSGFFIIIFLDMVLINMDVGDSSAGRFSAGPTPPGYEKDNFDKASWSDVLILPLVILIFWHKICSIIFMMNAFQISFWRLLYIEVVGGILSVLGIAVTMPLIFWLASVVRSIL